ncbi:MAG: hypothetical protein KKF46_03195 [Nanoarchaeota archaeon]|nr:hypothetical protein [Nanoarchaeota archaeon]MBU1321339.1 hypothetical protein [Nanoarchaeota archaeon]MBU1597262.1 hypothetical protein [Nanoarchaeota archaeon]MBU2441476.1 hypothetical protein [Nanoarchaeota archaeon]
MNKSESKCSFRHKCTGGCAYFLGFVGAAIYYISTATGFWNGVLGVLKALIWPLFLVLEVLKFIGA